MRLIMPKKRKKIFLICAILFGGIIFSQHIFTANAMNIVIQNPADAQTIQEIIDNILNFMMIIAIPISVIFLINAGLKLFMAQGNEQKIGSAKKTILWTIVGIAIIVGMRVISATIVEFFKTKGWSLIKKAYAGNAPNIPVWHVQNLTPYNTPADFINAIASFLFTIAMPLSVVAVIWTGIQFLLARGNETKITNAKKTLKWAVIGLALVIGAYAIVATIREAL